MARTDLKGKSAEENHSEMKKKKQNKYIYD